MFTTLAAPNVTSASALRAMIELTNETETLHPGVLQGLGFRV